MNYVIEVSYDGSKFYGFQRLNDEPSVQKYIEEALCKINKNPVSIKGAGRTDRGVHANGQCVSFKLDINIDEMGLKKALNSLLKPYIYVKNVKVVDNDFHARFNVKKKQYVYKINLGEFNPQLEDYVYQSEYILDVEKMKEVSKLYLGVHDFHNFVSGERDDCTCIIQNIEFKRDGDILNIVFEGKSFYRYMVRNLVGALILVGENKINPVDIKDMIDKKKKKYNYTTVPASGLYLKEIDY